MWTVGLSGVGLGGGGEGTTWQGTGCSSASAEPPSRGLGRVQRPAPVLAAGPPGEKAQARLTDGALPGVEREQACFIYLWSWSQPGQEAKGAPPFRRPAQAKGRVGHTPARRLWGHPGAAPVLPAGPDSPLLPQPLLRRIRKVLVYRGYSPSPLTPRPGPHRHQQTSPGPGFGATRSLVLPERPSNLEPQPPNTRRGEALGHPQS